MVNAGDQVGLSYTATGTPGAQACGGGMVFVPDVSGLYVLGGYAGTTTPTTATDRFSALSASNQSSPTTEDELVTRPVQASTIKNLYVLLSGATGSGSVLAVTLNKNTVASALTCTMTNAATCNLTTDVTVVDDDLLDTVYHHTGSAGTARLPNVSYSATFTGTFP